MELITFLNNSPTKIKSDIISNILEDILRWSMLPIITEEHSSLAFAEIFQDVVAWRKKMIHYLKEENPEINTAIIEAANNTDLDPKAVALGAYMTYVLLEMAMKDDETFMGVEE